MKNILKLAYFDEQAAVDFIEIKENGSSAEIMKVITEKNRELNIEANVNKGFLSLFKFGLSGNMNRKNNSIIETQITRTIYNKFVELSKEAPEIKRYDHIKLEIAKNSATYYRNIMPFIKMIDDSGEFENAEELKGLKHQELDKIFDDARGYYEFLGEIVTDGIDKEVVIIRFNINGMRNNYSLYDLSKMNLSIYGIEVGEVDSLSLDFVDEVRDMLQEDEVIVQEEIEYEELIEAKSADTEPESKRQTYKIIDAIVAGI